MNYLNKKNACDRCHSLKQVCIGVNPCENCSKLNNLCTFCREKIKIGRPPKIRKGDLDKTKAKGSQKSRKSYSHSGCSNCKRKKKKCDEKWPVCGNCNRLNLECSGEMITTGIKEINTTTELKTDNYSFILNEIFNPVEDKEIVSNDFSSFFSPGPESIFTEKEKMFLNSLLKSPNDQFDSPQKCSPVSHIDSNSYDYEYERKILLLNCMEETYNLPNIEAELLKYFITIVSPVLFADKTTASFLKAVIPISLVDKRVRYPILSISASHRANSAIEFNFQYNREKVVFRAKAQSTFMNEYMDFYNEVENILLSILLLAVGEIFEGTSLLWGVALEKAGSLIKSVGGLKKVTLISPLSSQLFCYLDLISSLSTCSSPFIEQKDNKDNHIDYDENYIETLLNSKFGFRFGIAGEIFKIIGNISTLASLRVNRYKNESLKLQFDSLANLIEMKLQKWSPPLDRVAGAYHLNKNEGRLILPAFTLSLQWSAFLRLHQIKDGYDRKDSRAKACLDNIISSMKVIEINTDLESSLMFPLIMAGSVAHKNEDRLYILSRISTIKQRLRFSYIGEFEKLLRQVWNSEDNDQVNWAKIRYFQFPGLVMF